MALLTTSYASEADASTYFSSIGTPDEWTNASSAERVEALINASIWLDLTYRQWWIGRRVTREQELDWPRTDAYDVDGFLIDDDEIPAELKQANAEAAVRHMQLADSGGLLPDPEEGSGIEREKIRVDTIAIEVDYLGTKKELPTFPKIDRMLERLLFRSNRVFLA